MTLGEKIQSLRKKNGWSQETLAEKINVSRQALSKWEADAAAPNVENIIQLSKLFCVTTDYLLFDEAETAETVSDGQKNKDSRSKRNAVTIILAVAAVLLLVWVIVLSNTNNNLRMELENAEVPPQIIYQEGEAEPVSLFHEESCELVAGSLSLENATVDYEVKLIPNEFNENTSIRLQVEGDDSFKDEYLLERKDNVFTAVITVPLFEGFGLNAVLEDGSNTHTGGAGGMYAYFNKDMEVSICGDSPALTGKGIGVNYIFEPMCWDDSEKGFQNFDEYAWPDNAEVILKKDGKEIYRAEIKDDNPDDEMPSYTWKDSLDFKDNSTVDVYILFENEEGFVYEYKLGFMKTMGSWITEEGRELKIMNPEGVVLYKKQIENMEF